MNRIQIRINRQIAERDTQRVLGPWLRTRRRARVDLKRRRDGSVRVRVCGLSVWIRALALGVLGVVVLGDGYDDELRVGNLYVELCTMSVLGN